MRAVVSSGELEAAGEGIDLAAECGAYPLLQVVDHDVGRGAAGEVLGANSSRLSRCTRMAAASWRWW